MPDSSQTAQQARQLIGAGRAEQARTLLARALQRAAADAELNSAMAEALSAKGQPDQALYFSERVVRSRPDDSGALARHGTMLLAAGKLAEAEDSLTRCVALDPANHGARVNLAGVQVMRERYMAALQQCEAAREAGFEHSFLTATHTSALRCLGRTEEALPMIRAGLAKSPDDPLLVEALATSLNYIPAADPAETLAAHVAFGQQIEHAAAARAGAAGWRSADPPRPADADRPLRLGIVSPDLRSHSVAFFAEPMLAHVDRSEFKVFVYFTGGIQDATTARLRTLADTWRDCGKTDDLALAKLIRSDAIDILIELSGPSSGHRLGTMAMRPAPLQVTCIGYPNTTGLASIDARIVDGLTDPPDADGRTVERLWRMDGCFLCYKPPADAPLVAAPPDRSVSFGSFNNLQKLNDRTISLWSRLLAQVPGARLVLKNPGLRQPEVRDMLRARFAAAGAAADRIVALPPTDGLAEHLAGYAEVDIALDTFPYCGTTTTCEALLMGVPVVSLVGSTHAARVGLSLLTAAGLPELVARTEDEYLGAAATLAGEPSRRTDLRTTLRSRLLGSPLCDGTAYRARLSRLLRAMWRDKCGAPARP